MKNLLIILILLANTTTGWAQLANNSANSLVFHSELEEEVLSDFISSKSLDFASLNLVVDASVNEKTIQDHKRLLDEWSGFLENKRTKYKSEVRFLSYMFYKVHRKILKEYRQYSSFNETLVTNEYDCLSATTLYAALLKNLGYQFDVIETNYHIYLRLELENNTMILLESTDPIYGFISDKTEIADRLKSYEDSNTYQKSRKGEYALKTKINSALNEESIVGLQYYNASVKAFNSGDIYLSAVLLEKATLFYHSSRIEELATVIAQNVLSDNTLATSKKRDLLNKIPSIKNGSREIASNFQK